MEGAERCFIAVAEVELKARGRGHKALSRPSRARDQIPSGTCPPRSISLDREIGETIFQGCAFSSIPRLRSQDE